LPKNKWTAPPISLGPTSTEGELINEHYIGQLIQALRAVKDDTKTLDLQKEFFDRVKK
jgi:hypothetical protein